MQMRRAVKPHPSMCSEESDKDADHFAEQVGKVKDKKTRQQSQLSGAPRSNVDLCDPSALLALASLLTARLQQAEETLCFTCS